MTFCMDNKGGVNLFNSWSIAGNTRATSMRLAFICKLKEARILKIEWVQGGNNSADLCAKNLSGSKCEKHVSECEDVTQTEAASSNSMHKEECRDEVNKNDVTEVHWTQDVVPPQRIPQKCVDG